MEWLIPLGNGGFAQVDAEDFERVMSRHWYAVRRGRRNKRLYAESSATPQVMLHRFILGAAADGLVVDHINGDGLDNRRANLRACTQRENARNRGAISGYCGVSWKADIRKWNARITVDRKGIALGAYDTPEAAAAAYNEAAKSYFGEFAKLNVIPAANDEVGQ